MLSPTEIYDNVDALAARRPVGSAFGLDLVEAVGAPRATITRLGDAGATGAFTWTRMLRFETVGLGQADKSLEAMKAEAETTPKARRPRLLIAYDGEGLAAHDTRVGDEIHVDVLPPEADFFFPLGGHERYVTMGGGCGRRRTQRLRLLAGRVRRRPFRAIFVVTTANRR